MKNLQILLILIFMFSSCKSRPDKLDSRISDTSIPDTTFFKSLVTQYVESIDKADTALGAKLWSHVDEISFINPRGHEHGWEGIKNIYSMFRDNFSERKLSFYKLNTSIYNDFAWLEFYWIFDAVRIPDNTKTQTRGRETQIWRKINTEWRLIHIHYSGMPVTNPVQGS
jgi:hypothetical protein